MLESVILEFKNFMCDTVVIVSAGLATFITNYEYKYLPYNRLFENTDCKIVRRKGRLYVINKKNPRFKQRQG